MKIATANTMAKQTKTSLNRGSFLLSNYENRLWRLQGANFNEKHDACSKYPQKRQKLEI